MSIAVEQRLKNFSNPSSIMLGRVSDSWPVVLPYDVSLKVSLADFQQISSLNPESRLELTAQGDLIVMPPESSWSGHRNAKISQYLGMWADQHGGYEFGSSAGFILPDGSCRSPDASWISSDRWNALSAEDKSGFARICPDFVVELRSPSDSLPDLEAKMEEYMANGASLGWLIDPLSKTATVYRAGRAPESLVGPQHLSGENVLAGFALNLASIFKEPD
ncbi:MAG: Uma2 family endonuclease [Planctomycetota bacterium]